MVNHLDAVSDALAEQRFSQRRHVGNEPFGGIGLVLADELECLALAALVFDDDAMAEANVPLIVHRLSREAPSVPDQIRAILNAATHLKVIIAHMGRRTPVTSV